MASFVPVIGILGEKLSANLDNCNYMEDIENEDSKTTVLHFPGSDKLHVKDTQEELHAINKRLYKDK